MDEIKNKFAPISAIPTDLLIKLEGHTIRNLKEIRAEMRKRGIK
jgi:hypothetical protein